VESMGRVGRKGRSGEQGGVGRDVLGCATAIVYNSGGDSASSIFTVDEERDVGKTKWKAGKGYVIT